MFNVIQSNPLMRKIASLNDERRKGLIALATRKADVYEGIPPASIGITPVRHGGNHISDHLIARWEDVPLTEERIASLEGMVREIESPYAIEGRYNRLGQRVRPAFYKKESGNVTSRVRGYRISWDRYRNNGLYIMREFKTRSEAIKRMRSEKGTWLYNGKRFVELRLPLGSTTSFEALEYVTRIACVLAGEDVGDKKRLVYDLYRSLMLQTVTAVTEDKLIGLGGLLDFIKWTMFGSTMSPATKFYGIRDKGVVLAGVPGVGKSTIAKVLSGTDNGALFVPIETNVLLKELDNEREDETSLPDALQQLEKRTGASIALYCDDIESAMVDPEQGVLMPQYLAGTSTLLNRLEGVFSGAILLSGSTNNPFIMDRRFLEFGRVGYVLHVPLPDEVAREKTLDLYTKGKREETVRFDDLVQQTAGFSNRALEEVCNWAGKNALKRAIKAIRKNGESTEMAAYRVTPEMAEADFPVTEEDLRKGFEIVRKHIRVKDIQRTDKEIARFCEESGKLGF